MRQRENLRHKLVDIVFIGLVSVICGGTDYVHMEDTGYGKREWHILTFSHVPRRRSAVHPKKGFRHPARAPEAENVLLCT